MTIESADWDDPRIKAHLDAQEDVPDGMVRMDDGTLKPIGGNRHTEDGADGE